MYALIQNNLASMFELSEYYTLDEALKLYALMEMHRDIESMQMDEAKKGGN